VILSPGEVLQVSVPEFDEKPESATSRSGQTLEEAERLHILETLNKTRWVVSGPRGAAARLGLNRSTLQFRMKKLGIERPSIANEIGV
jgi:formate hydrogenlyase transcriptional activator